jgi:hypothetical protein
VPSRHCSVLSQMQSSFDKSILARLWEWFWTTREVDCVTMPPCLIQSASECKSRHRLVSFISCPVAFLAWISILTVGSRNDREAKSNLWSGNRLLDAVGISAAISVSLVVGSRLLFALLSASMLAADDHHPWGPQHRPSTPKQCLGYSQWQSRRSKVFHRSVASQNLTFRKRNWICQFKYHSIYSPFPSIHFAIGSPILETLHPKSYDRVPFKVSWIADKSSSVLLNELLWITPFRYRESQKSEEPDLANHEDEVLASGIVIQKLNNCFPTMRSRIVSVNHKVSPSVILIRSKNFG